MIWFKWGGVGPKAAGMEEWNEDVVIGLMLQGLMCWLWVGAWAQLVMAPILVGQVACPGGAGMCVGQPADYQIIMLPIFPTPSLASNTCEQGTEALGTEAEIQFPLKRSSRFQHLFPNPSWSV